MVADLFHPGHVRFLAAARALGDHLTVSLVPDERVRAGKGRAPVLSLAERVEVVAACRHVDEVVTWGPRVTTLAFMREHGFAVYAFGAADERELAAKLADCAELPAEMRAVLPYSADISTTLLLARIAARAGDAR